MVQFTTTTRDLPSFSNVVIIGTKCTIEKEIHENEKSWLLSVMFGCVNSGSNNNSSANSNGNKSQNQKPMKRARTNSTNNNNINTNNAKSACANNEIINLYEKECNQLKQLISTLVPTPDEGALIDYWYTPSSEVSLSTGNTTATATTTTTAAPTTEPLIKATFCALPTEYSRNNCPSRTHAIVEFIKKNRLSYAAIESLLIVVLLDEILDPLAISLAISRGFPLYTRKNGKAQGIPGIITEDNIQKDNITVLFSPSNHNRPINCNEIQQVADGVRLAARLVDAPPNELTTETFTTEALHCIRGLPNVKQTIIKGEELKKQGFGGLYNVGKAALSPPVLLHLAYTPSHIQQDDICTVLVGKGICYDTGGYSLKPAQAMVGMKRDMGGAAAVLGTFTAAVKCNLPMPLHAIICLAENAIGPNATKPDEVHILYSGKSVEINNTDAEGRLVLADGAAYAVKNISPSLLIDIATLTGAQGIATGRNVSAIYCNNEDLEQNAIKIGRRVGELACSLPYIPEFYKPEFKSTIADMKNSVKDRFNASSACAGQFVGNHLPEEFEKHKKWLHIDMAYPTFSVSDERATGYGVGLLYSILTDYVLSKSKEKNN